MTITTSRHGSACSVNGLDSDRFVFVWNARGGVFVTGNLQDFSSSFNCWRWPQHVQYSRFDVVDRYTYIAN